MSERVVVAQIGARRHYAVPRALHEAGLLHYLYTDACRESMPWRLLAPLDGRIPLPAPMRRVLGRTIAPIPHRMVRGFPFYFLTGIVSKSGKQSLTERWAARNKAFSEHVLRRGLSDATVLYGFNAASLEIFQFATSRGIRTVLDQTMVPWREVTSIIRREQERFPGWEDDQGEVDPQGHLARREEAEWEIADRIVCGSRAVLESLVRSGVPHDKIDIVPTTHQVPRKPLPREPRKAGAPLRILFVGTLQLRKGIQYLYDALRQLPPDSYEARFVGPSRLTPHGVTALSQVGEVVGAVPRSEVARHYAWADVFVLPTLAEGAANVCYEAALAGLPIITTRESGFSPEGLNFIPSADAQALHAAIQYFLKADHYPHSVPVPKSLPDIWGEYVNALSGAVAGCRKQLQNMT